ncbi:MAG TPA: DUF362 domain-containing protein [Chloroflexia bacterium]|nr:DUF362 domain-containing protein [Chloroflexia bacterium]
MAKVAVVKASPNTVLDDYARLMHLADYQQAIPKENDTLIKLNLSWSKYFPACSSEPWQVEGVVRTLIQDGYDPQRLRPIENKTVVTNPIKGAKENLWLPILRKYGLYFTPLPGVEWVNFDFQSPLMILNHIFPEGIYIPKMFIGRNILHLPTVKTHGHAVTTGAIKNSFGGLLREVRHYSHKYMHEVLVDLMYMQKELHSGVFAVMDGTVAGDGAGPRTMEPVITDYILASEDQVAIDSIAAKMMGFDPMEIPYIRMCHERGLGIGDPKDIEIVGENIDAVNFGFKTKRSFVIWGDQMLRKGGLKFLERIALHSPLVFWAPIASNLYHDQMWYPTVGQAKIKEFMTTPWGELWQKYNQVRDSSVVIKTSPGPDAELVSAKDKRMSDAHAYQHGAGR